MRIAKALFVGLALAGAPVAAQQQGMATPQVEQVLKQLHELNQAQIDIGKIAQQKAMSNDVRELGMNLEKKHAELDRKVIEIARNKGIDLQVGGEPMQDQKVQQLNGMQGQQFDKQFLTNLMEGHPKAINELTRSAAQIRDRDVSRLVNDALPLLHDEYEKASTRLAKFGTQKEKS